MTKFVEQISMKFRGFILVKMDLAQTVQSTPKYRWKFVYRPIFKMSNIGRYYWWTVISVGL